MPDISFFFSSGFLVAQVLLLILQLYCFYYFNTFNIGFYRRWKKQKEMGDRVGFWFNCYIFGFC